MKLSGQSRASQLSIKTIRREEQTRQVPFTDEAIFKENPAAKKQGAIKGFLAQVADKENLSETASEYLMQQILDGVLTPVQLASLITALKMKGETVEEVTGFARAMRTQSTRLNLPASMGDVIDTCGTGGDVPDTFNISTAAALVAAACGQKVAKHGNKAVSSTCGSADVLEALGVELTGELALIEKCLENVGFGFLYAPKHHQSMKHAKAPRQEMGLKTIFNLLGPLTNPANAERQLIGVYDESLTEFMAEVLYKLGTKKAWVVHGYDGTDEISICAPTKVTQLNRGKITNFVIYPADYGFEKANLEAIAGADQTENAQIINNVLQGESGPCRDVVVLNAGAALVVGETVDNLTEGIKRAETQLDNGRAQSKLKQLIHLTREAKPC